MLVRSIVSQQISTSAARAIRKRLQDLAGPEGLTAANLVRFTPEQLRSVGLSPQKAAYVTDLSAKVNDEGTSVSRYETDLLVYDALDQDVWIPRVVIECKLEGVTTHDAITYSRKASTHKQVHPYLRYGILIGSWGKGQFPARLFRHGEHFDVMAIWAGVEPTDTEWQDFTAVLSDEIKSSRKIHEILTSNRSPVKTRYTPVHRPLRFR